jgi:hypothetical protein
MKEEIENEPFILRKWLWNKYGHPQVPQWIIDEHNAAIREAYKEMPSEEGGGINVSSTM